MNKKSTKYALIESVIQSWSQGEETIQETIKVETERKKADEFIKKVTIVITHDKDYYLENKTVPKKSYNYTDDFIAIVLTLSKVLDIQNMNTYILRCKNLSISFKDMEFFFCVLDRYGCNFSPDLICRVKEVHYALSLICQFSSEKLRECISPNNTKIKLNDKLIKEKLLFYIISKNNYTKIKITEKLTLSELIKKLEQNH